MQPARYSAELSAGEHIAGTEFTIGVLWVALGVSTKDVIIGLLVGNMLAVVTWMFICAPIAARTRLTLYRYLREIARPDTTALYNALNVLLDCILAGCMITVSASAVRVLFGVPVQIGWQPTDIRVALVAIAVGAVVVALTAMRGNGVFVMEIEDWLLRGEESNTRGVIDLGMTLPSKKTKSLGTVANGPLLPLFVRGLYRLFERE